MKLIITLLSILTLAGCFPDDGPGVTGHDLTMAYLRCIQNDGDLVETRIACTQAVYGKD